MPGQKCKNNEIGDRIGEHGKGVLALKSINTEIINLRKEFQEKEEQVKIKK